MARAELVWEMRAEGVDDVERSINMIDVRLEAVRLRQDYLRFSMAQYQLSLVGGMVTAAGAVGNLNKEFRATFDVIRGLVSMGQMYIALQGVELRQRAQLVNSLREQYWLEVAIERATAAGNMQYAAQLTTVQAVTAAERQRAITGAAAGIASSGPGALITAMMIISAIGIAVSAITSLTATAHSGGVTARGGLVNVLPQEAIIPLKDMAGGVTVHNHFYAAVTDDTIRQIESAERRNLVAQGQYKVRYR